MLRAGALPVSVEILENRSVGRRSEPTPCVTASNPASSARLSSSSLMLVYYGFLGIAADIALCAAMLIVVAMMIALHSTLTLPGIGGMVLTIGMAVDGNILNTNE